MDSIALGGDAGQEVEGALSGGEVSVIVIDTSTGGVGPALHQHPYPETFVLVTGTVRFWVGDQDVVATGPSVQVAPAFTPHRFETLDRGPVRMVDVHASPRFITEWL